MNENGMKTKIRMAASFEEEKISLVLEKKKAPNLKDSVRSGRTAARR